MIRASRSVSSEPELFDQAKDTGRHYKLIDAMTESVRLNLAYMKDGKRINSFYTLYPGKLYKGHANDETFINGLKDAHKRIMYSPQREEALKKCGAKFEVVNCKSCGGRVKKIETWLVEVIE